MIDLNLMPKTLKCITENVPPTTKNVNKVLIYLNSYYQRIDSSLLGITRYVVEFLIATAD